MDIDGIAATITDTAGIRNDENIDKVEAIGIDYSKKYVQEADLVLFLYDLSEGFTAKDKELFVSYGDSYWEGRTKISAGQEKNNEEL